MGISAFLTKHSQAVADGPFGIFEFSFPNGQ